MDAIEEFYEDFELFNEDANEQLEIMESTLLDIMDMPLDTIDKEMINTVFRAMHTIKGNAGMFNFKDIVSFTHLAENVLDKVRNGEITLTSDMIEDFLLVKDHTITLIQKTINKGKLNETEQKEQDNLIKQLSTYLGLPIQIQETQEEKIASEKNYMITIKLKYDFLRSGMDLISIINYLNVIGTTKDIRLLDDAIPSFDQLNPLDAYMKFIIKYTTDEPKEEISEAFKFVQEDIELTIDLEDQKTQLNNNPKEIQNEQNIVPQITSNSQKPQIKQINKQKNVTNTVENFSLRVDSSKIDSLIKKIGEMVIVNSKIMEKTQNYEDNELEESVDVMSDMLEEVRDAVMNIRMVQVGDSFSKLRRTVNETAKKMGKDVLFEIYGEDTELDKTVIEKISDPLVHMLRNSIDHGIETPEQRVAAGKKEQGKVILRAFTDTGSIIIQIEDDGAGLDKEVIMNKALEKGLIGSDTDLSDTEIYNLLFKPGFSTAKEVSDISGRGVGMDVVKKNIDNLRGQVDIQSTLGIGTVMTIRLPLTLAIIDGFLIQASQTKYIIPLNMIQECIELTKAREESLLKDGYIILRSQILPILNIVEYFEESEISSKRQNIVVVKYGDAQIGLLVEELYGELQTVIKSLGDLFDNVNGIMGGTILGSGEIALIFDIPKLIDHKIKVSNKEG